MAFLDDHDLRPLELGDARAFRPVGLALGKGAQPVEVAVIEASHRPSLSDLRTLWKARLKGRATPLLMVALYDGHAAICGPAGDQPPAFADLDPELVERICRAALEEPDRHAALRRLHSVIPNVEAPLAGLRNEGLFATHELEHDVRRRADWPEANSRATPVLRERGEALLRALGFSVEPLTAGPGSILRAAGTRTVLVVAPAGLVLQWRREFRLWAPELRLLTVLGTSGARDAIWRGKAQVYIASYETVRTDLGNGGHGNHDWDVVIIDEAQRIKNADADISRAVKRLPRRYGWALSGTPLENSLDDLISILDFVAPGRFRPGTFARGLRRLLGEVQLRRRRADVLHDLPPKLPVQVLVDLEPRQRLAYERAEREGIIRLAGLGADLRINHVLELILRLKQICNFCPETGDSAKLIDLRERLQRIVTSGERALVFSQFAAEPFGVKRLARELKEFHPLVLSGDLPVEARAEVIRQFEREHERKLLLLSLRVGGIGLNLTAASYVFHFDRWWNPAVESQAEDRTHRIGQVRPVHVYSYLCANTVEERVATILAEKRQLFADVVDGVSLHHIRRLDLADLLSTVSSQTT